MAMSKATVVVSFSYDLPSDDNLNSQFRKVLEGLGWMYTLGSVPLPDTVCVYSSDQGSEHEAIAAAVAQIKEVIKKIREAGYPHFNVDRYFFLAHAVPSSVAAYGEKLL